MDTQVAEHLEGRGVAGRGLLQGWRLVRHLKSLHLFLNIPSSAALYSGDKSYNYLLPWPQPCPPTTLEVANGFIDKDAL